MLALFQWICAIFLSLIICGFFIIVLSFYDWRSSSLRKKCRLLPSPEAKFLFGHAFELGSLKSKEILSYFGKLIEETGPVGYLEIFGKPLVYLTKAEDIESVMTNMKCITKGQMYSYIKPWIGEGLIISAGNKWQFRRKLLTPTFHFKVLENFMPVLNRNAKQLVAKLLNSTRCTDSIKILPLISHSTLSVICETTMGVFLDFESPEVIEYISAVQIAKEIITMRSFKFWMSNDLLFNLSPTGWKFRRTLKLLHGFTNNVIRQRQEYYKTHKDELVNSLGIGVSLYKRPKSFLDCLIEFQKADPEIMTDEDIREEVDTVIFAGHDTTSSATTWALFMIAAHSHVQDKLQDEMKEIFGDSDRDATRQDLQQMQYLEMVIKETIRLYPPVPFLSRRIETDLKLNQFDIPAGAIVTLILYWIHRDPDVFPDPEKFDPERFLSENANKRHPFSYTPFSAGYRNCIGQKLAMMEMKTLISTIIRKARIYTSLKKDEVTAIPQTILQADPEIILSFIPVK